MSEDSLEQHIDELQARLARKRRRNRSSSSSSAPEWESDDAPSWAESTVEFQYDEEHQPKYRKVYHLIEYSDSDDNEILSILEEM